MSATLIYPDWPAPDNITAISTTRQGGFSLQPYNELNLGTHVGDDINIVTKNRHTLEKIAALPESPRWLNQVHGTDTINSMKWREGSTADAIVSSVPNQVCTVMTADCLPILLCNQQGSQVAAIHAGWRGLAAGIIEKTLQRFNCSPQEIIAWLGPAIGPTQFEVGSNVYHTFTQQEAIAKQAFQQTGANHYLADIYLLAKQRLMAHGTYAIFGGEYCTVSEPERFFSYRRDGITGRMASMIWLTDK